MINYISSSFILKEKVNYLWNTQNARVYLYLTQNNVRCEHLLIPYRKLVQIADFI